MCGSWLVVLESIVMIDNPPPWPGGKRCAVAFSFDVDADSTVHISAPERLDKELAALAYLRYDPLVAVWLEVAQMPRKRWGFGVAALR